MIFSVQMRAQMRFCVLAASPMANNGRAVILVTLEYFKTGQNIHPAVHKT